MSKRFQCVDGKLIMKDISQKLIEQMLCDRRTLHRRPELGWTEFEASSYVADRLNCLNIDFKVGGEFLDIPSVQGRSEQEVQKAIKRALAHGVPESFIERTQGYTGIVGFFDTKKPGPTIAIRADLDAVPVQESSDPSHEAVKGDYASAFPGVMHACGHDAHTSILLALAEWIVQNKEDLCGKFKFVFQPAEEGVRGGLAVANGGVLDDVDELLCFHIGSKCKLGEIGICEKGFLATTKLNVSFEGVPAHAGSNPEAGKSALLAACNAATLIAGIPRHSGGLTRVCVGKLIAGESRNVIPVHASMEIETRGETAELDKFMVENVKRIVTSSAAAFDLTAKVEIIGSAVNLETDKEISLKLQEIAEANNLAEKVTYHNDVPASEDCTWLIKRVREKGGKAGYFMFGCNNNGHHKSDFSIQDESTLPVGLKMLKQYVVARCSAE